MSVKNNPWPLTDPGAPLVPVSWTLTVILCIFTIENLWIDPWLRTKLNRLPSLVPEGLGGAWFIVAAAVAVALVLLWFCQFLMWKRSRSSAGKKLLRASAAMIALFLCATWFLSTSGMELGKRLSFIPKHHTVTLHWQRSITSGVKYNVYRSTTRGKNYTKLNDKPISGVTYKDKDVKNGVTYYYVARSVDSTGRESVDSDFAQATIPPQ